jgi:hypothetical protein
MRSAEILFKDVEDRMHEHMNDFYPKEVKTFLEKYLHYWCLRTDADAHYWYAIYLRKTDA